MGATVDGVVKDEDVRPLLEVLLDLDLGTVVVVQRQHALDEPVQSRVLAVGEPPGLFHRSGQFGQKPDHVGHGRAAVDAQRPGRVVTRIREVYLRRMAGGASVPDVVLALIRLLRETHGQGVGIEEGRLLGQVAEPVDVLVAQEPPRLLAVSFALDLLQPRLFQDQQEVVRQQPRPLGGVVEPEAVGFVPSLIQVLRDLIAFREGPVCDGYRTTVGIVIPPLVCFAHNQ